MTKMTILETAALLGKLLLIINLDTITKTAKESAVTRTDTKVLVAAAWRVKLRGIKPRGVGSRRR